MFPKPKDPVTTEDTEGIVYEIPCNDCSKIYVDESKRKFKTRVKEHKKAVAQLEIMKSALAEHHKLTGHNIAWNDGKIVCTCENWYKRRGSMDNYVVPKLRTYMQTFHHADWLSARQLTPNSAKS